MDNIRISIDGLRMVDARAVKPEKNGEYIVLLKTGNLWRMDYTAECGWNTFKAKDNVFRGNPLPDNWVIAWCTKNELKSSLKVGDDDDRRWIDEIY